MAHFTSADRVAFVSVMTECSDDFLAAITLNFEVFFYSMGNESIYSGRLERRLDSLLPPFCFQKQKYDLYPWNDNHVLNQSMFSVFIDDRLDIICLVVNNPQYL